MSLFAGTARTIGPGAHFARSLLTAADAADFCVFLGDRCRLSPASRGRGADGSAAGLGSGAAEGAGAGAASISAAPVQRGGRAGGEAEPDGGQRRRQ